MQKYINANYNITSVGLQHKFVN